MRTTAKTNKLLLVSLVYFVLFSSVLAAEYRLEFLDSYNQPIRIFAKNNLIEISRAKKKISLDRESKRILTQMDSILVISNRTFLLDSQQYFWAFIRLPSKNSHGAGFCGAGLEDFLVLFKIQRSNLYLIDKYQAQSCLNSISINIDQIEEVDTKIAFSRENGIIQFSQEFVNSESVYSKTIRLTPLSLRILVQSTP
ncbi:MAG TPA: hypothetical protein VFF81_14550 [Noviherbaspirillum sp.]|nr:hypothetical protein [Noviherbaspirillum sp.]